MLPTNKQGKKRNWQENLRMGWTSTPEIIHDIPSEEPSKTQPKSLKFVEYTELNPKKSPVCCQLTTNFILFNQPKSFLQWLSPEKYFHVFFPFAFTPSTAPGKSH